ncbi:MAG: GNAT family N-acetyltransferase [Clostridiaceae bacterium]|nr:GNAT family N-acetyltransferase [Clostridiaceae bacterium]
MTEYIKDMRSLVGHSPILQCGASVILINENNEILLQKRRDNGCWGYHGGSVELDEVVEDAAKRELFEETGLTADKLDLFGVFSGADMHYVYPNGDEVSNVDIVYICRDYHGEIIRQKSEVDELKFFKSDLLPENLSPPIKPVLKKYVESLKKQDTAVFSSEYSVMPISDKYRSQVDALIEKEWAGPLVVTKGKIIDTRQCPGFVAVQNATLLGYITYQINGAQCEITVLESLVSEKGIGSALIKAVIETAKQAGCSRVWLITTNDNTHAIRFYQRFGFQLANVHINALERSQELKLSIPMTGIDDIPILHEFEFEVII